MPDGHTISSDQLSRDMESMLRLQAAALNSAANAIIITNRDGRIEWVNPAFTTLTGYSAAEDTGQNPRLLKSGKHDEQLYAEMWRKRLFVGTGLGLWVTSELVKKHEGTIRMKSKPGSGTVVTLWLPLERRAQERRYA